MRNLFASGDRLVGNFILADAAEKQPTKSGAADQQRRRKG